MHRSSVESSLRVRCWLGMYGTLHTLFSDSLGGDDGDGFSSNYDDYNDNTNDGEDEDDSDGEGDEGAAPSCDPRRHCVLFEVFHLLLARRGGLEDRMEAGCRMLRAHARLGATKEEEVLTE